MPTSLALVAGVLKAIALPRTAGCIACHEALVIDAEGWVGLTVDPGHIVDRDRQGRLHDVDEDAGGVSPL